MSSSIKKQHVCGRGALSTQVYILNSVASLCLFRHILQYADGSLEYTIINIHGSLTSRKTAGK